MSSVKYWFRLVVGAICLPVVFPWLVYQLYQSKYRNKIHRMHSLQNKVVLITGASSGLGEALAHVFYVSGCKLILASRRLSELERVKNDLLSRNTDIHHVPKIVILDLNDLNAIPDKAIEILRMHGQVDILINNGGISYRGKAEDTDLDTDVKLMVVNYFGHVALTKAILPSMKLRNSGTIVAISSIQGKIAIPYRSAYAASKHALQAFFDTLRAELSDTNIKVCVINPGYIRTNLSLNALCHDGSTYGLMDSTTASGMEPFEVADKILKAVIHQQNEITLSPLLPKLAIILRVLMPSFYFHLMANRARRIKQQEARKIE